MFIKHNFDNLDGDVPVWAPVGTMKRNYQMFHTMAPELAIEDLKEIGGLK